MIGDLSDIIARMKAALPTRWFPDSTPVLDAVLSGLASGWSSLYALLASVRLQSRIATATGTFLDNASADFFGERLRRGASEQDAAFSIRIRQRLTRDHATRAALSSVLQDLTGRIPAIFEPARITDTGAYASGSFAYGSSGAWGSMDLPFQIFATVRRPQASGIANVAGYDTGGPLARASLDQAGSQVTDADIYAAITSVMPTATIAWTQITN